jgi:hypothetical protein
VIKRDELANPNSCLNRAKDDEYVFVLKGTDITTPGTIRDWVKRRIQAGKNRPDDAQIVNALVDARAIEERQHKDHIKREVLTLPPEYTGETCTICGGLIRVTGSCRTCSQCGANTGCG